MLKRMGDIDVKLGLKTVLDRIEIACQKRCPELQLIKPTLVAVTKTKPPEMIIECYEAGQRHFGENYIQELVEKSNNKDILERCRDIKWHFIGRLQSNKVNKVLATPNLHLIETVDCEKLATKLNLNWPNFRKEEEKLRIFLQVNTSNEEEKGGVNPKEVFCLAKFVLTQCPNLQLDGLMTIGKFGYDSEDGPNPDFLCLKSCRDELCQNLDVDWKNVQLSMGMSADYEQAIELGSTNVRVGSSIFGERVKKNT